MTKDEAMQMAMDALNNFDKGNHGMRWQVPVIEALRTALAQPEKECSRVECGGNNGCIDICWKKKPQRKEWVGLTDDEYELMAEKRVTNYFFNTLDYAHDIEAKLKEKNT